MTILADFILMMINSWFSDCVIENEEGEDAVLSFFDKADFRAKETEININLHGLRDFDNFKGGFFVSDDTKTCATLIIYIEDENGDLMICMKHFQITY